MKPKEGHQQAGKKRWDRSGGKKNNVGVSLQKCVGTKDKHRYPNWKIQFCWLHLSANDAISDRNVSFFVLCIPKRGRCRLKSLPGGIVGSKVLERRHPGGSSASMMMSEMPSSHRRSPLMDLSNHTFNAQQGRLSIAGHMFEREPSRLASYSFSTHERAPKPSAAAADGQATRIVGCSEGSRCFHTQIPATSGKKFDLCASGSRWKFQKVSLHV
jgi:hypothetical protein